MRSLFREMYKAYREGRAEKDPSDFWYKGEIGFFDFYSKFCMANFALIIFIIYHS